MRSGAGVRLAPSMALLRGLDRELDQLTCARFTILCCGSRDLRLDVDGCHLHAA